MSQVIVCAGRRCPHCATIIDPPEIHAIWMRDDVRQQVADHVTWIHSPCPPTNREDRTVLLDGVAQLRRRWRRYGGDMADIEQTDDMRTIMHWIASTEGGAGTWPDPGARNASTEVRALAVAISVDPRDDAPPQAHERREIIRTCIASIVRDDVVRIDETMRWLYPPTPRGRVLDFGADPCTQSVMPEQLLSDVLRNSGDDLTARPLRDVMRILDWLVSSARFNEQQLQGDGDANDQLTATSKRCLDFGN